MDTLHRNSICHILQPIDIVTSLNLKTATAGARVARFVVPPSVFTKSNALQNGWEIIGHFFAVDGAGGAITTASVLTLNINGTESQVNNPAGTAINWSRLTYTASLADGTNLAATVEGTVFTNPPAALTASQPLTYYPTCKDGDLLETWLLTQGAGAGAQTGRPFVIVRARFQS